MTEEKLDFTRRLLIWGNLALLTWILLAFLNVFFFNWLYRYLFLLPLTFMVHIILRKLGCSCCYKCKACTSGFGRVAGVFFGKEFVKREFRQQTWIDNVYLFSTIDASNSVAVNHMLEF